MRPKDERSKLSIFAAFLCAAAAATGATSCQDDPRGDVKPPEVRGPRPAMPDLAAQTGAQRLTTAQYANIVHDVFGDSVAVPTSLEPDAPADGFASLGSSKSSISPHGVEQYEKAAFAIAKQITQDAALKSAVLPCKPSGAADADCAGKVVTALGRRLFRRPLAAAEIDKFKALALQASAALGGFDGGLEFVIAALLQSPHFLYRPQLGRKDALHEP
jgi:hypothetical protein